MQRNWQLWDARPVRAVGLLLIGSALLKFAQPAPVVDYMGSMGFQGGTYFLVAAIELVVAACLFGSRTRWIGVLLGSAYLGGAVASHIATHRYFDGGPFLAFMATNPLLGAVFPAAILVVLWWGAWRAQIGRLSQA